MSYQGGIKTRLDDLWGAEVLGPNGLPVGYHETLERMRNRSRHLERNNVLAAGVLDRACENVIGTGITLRPTTDSPVFNQKAADLWRRKIEGKLFDVRRMYSFDKMQSMLYRGTHRDGDIAILLVDRGAGPEIQIIEGHSIVMPRTNFNQNIVDGVEFNGVGAPVAYWIEEIDSVGISRPRRVLARDIVFLHRSTRYSVARGEPSFHGSYSLYDGIVGVLDAVVVAWRVGASQALIVKLKNPTRGGLGQRSLTTNSEGQSVQARIIEPGMINFIYEGEDIQGFNPTQPSQSFPDAIAAFARFLGLKFGLTLERVLLDFSKANYSVSRSTALQEQRTAEVEQWWFHLDLFARLWPWFIAKAIKDGDLVGPVPEDAWRFDSIVNGRPLVEPSKDASGLKILTEMGLPPQEIFGKMGYDTEQICKDSAKWVELRQKHGNLPPYGFSAAAGTDPIQPAEPDADEDPQDGNAGNGGEIEVIKARADAYGVAVRAGVITPQQDDEDEFRQLLDLPQMKQDARRAWDEDRGVRRPITLVQSGTASPPPPPTDVEQ